MNLPSRMIHEGIIFGPEKYVKEVITWRDVNVPFVRPGPKLQIRRVWIKWSFISKRKTVDQNYDSIHMPSRDYLLHILFWTKNYTLVYQFFTGYVLDGMILSSMVFPFQPSKMKGLHPEIFFYSDRKPLSGFFDSLCLGSSPARIKIGVYIGFFG